MHESTEEFGYENSFPKWNPLDIPQQGTVAWVFYSHCAVGRNSIGSFRLIDGTTYTKDQIHTACPTGVFVHDSSGVSFIPYSSILLVTMAKA